MDILDWRAWALQVGPPWSSWASTVPGPGAGVGLPACQALSSLCLWTVTIVDMGTADNGVWHTQAGSENCICPDGISLAPLLPSNRQLWFELVFSNGFVLISPHIPQNNCKHNVSLGVCGVSIQQLYYSSIGQCTADYRRVEAVLCKVMPFAFDSWQLGKQCAAQKLICRRWLC